MRLVERKSREGKTDCDLCKRSGISPVREVEFPQSNAHGAARHWIDLCADCIERKRNEPREFAALGEFVKAEIATAQRGYSAPGQKADPTAAPRRKRAVQQAAKNQGGAANPPNAS